MSASTPPISTIPSAPLAPDQESKVPVTILMVDDQPSKLLSYEAILGDLGENLIKASSGREALDHLLKEDVAVVLMDVSMPEIDGFELADMLRQHPRFQKTPIIFISAVHLTDVDRLRGYRSGAVDYISVPVIPDVLRAKVNIFAELHRKTRLLQKLNRELEARVAERSKELRMLNSQLQERVAELESIMKVLPMGVAVAHDPKCDLVTGNAAFTEMLGVKLGEDLSKSEGGKGGYQIFEKGKQVTLQNLPMRKAILAGQATATIELEVRAGNDSPVHLLASASPLFDDLDNIRGAVGVFFNVTQHKQMEEALRRNDRLTAMGKLAGMVAHEINNPLESIINVFYLLRDHPSLDVEAQHYANLAEQELLRVSHITRQTLSFYRESQKPIQVSVADLLDDVLELQKLPLQKHRISLERRYSIPGLVHGFPMELKQVFMNLISNAIQAMPEGGRLRVCVLPSSHRRYSGTYISISDTGSGIGLHEAKRLFEPFFTTKSTKGTGLGLWISRGIVQKHDGTLHFRSVFRSSGAATCFQVFLPSD